MGAKSKHYKTNEEFNMRYNLWKDAISYINHHNQLNRTYTVGPTFFADLTFEEKKSYINGIIRPPSRLTQLSTTQPRFKSRIPDRFDWRDHGAVTNVKDQKQCGSSPMFGCIAVIEAAHVTFEGGPLTNLSSQQLIDCCPLANETLMCSGCMGSFYEPLFDYVIQYGLESEEDYPYSGQDEVCKYEKDKVKARISKYFQVPPGDEEECARAIAENGPLANAVDANTASFMYYTAGIYDDPDCKKNVDHGIAIVGYGVDDTNNPFWVLKNSWGWNWGENGYIRIARGKDLCGVSQDCFYAGV